MEGKFVPVKETIQGFRDILDGKYDSIPESAFLFCGGIEDVLKKAEEIKKAEELKKDAS